MYNVSITARSRILNLGKPKFSKIDVNQQVSLDKRFVARESWLLFHLLGLTGDQDWLNQPVSSWNKCPEYQKLRKFTTKVHVVNDLAERGIKLITDFIEKCKD
jgi:hypothetical protein